MSITYKAHRNDLIRFKQVAVLALKITSHPYTRTKVVVLVDRKLALAVVAASNRCYQFSRLMLRKYSHH